MYRKCATEISAQHQRQVAETLLELMKKMPYEDITVTQLCQSAGVSRRVFYHLFSNKTGALHALMDQKILNVEGYGQDIADDTIRFLYYWRELKPFLDVLAENGMTGLLLERLISIVLTEDYDVKYLLERKGWNDNSQEVIIFSLSGLMGLVYSWYYSGFQRSPEELAVLVDQLMRPFADS